MIKVQAVAATSCIKSQNRTTAYPTELQGVSETRNPTLTLYNLDKTKFHSLILGSIVSLIICLFKEGSLVYFRQITTSAEKNYQKRSFLDAYIPHSASNFQHSETHLGSIFGESNWKLESIV